VQAAVGWFFVGRVLCGFASSYVYSLRMLGEKKIGAVGLVMQGNDDYFVFTSRKQHLYLKLVDVIWVFFFLCCSVVLLHS
jgi:hypothetical protein